MKTQVVTLLGVLFLLGCQATPVSSGLEAQVGKYCKVKLANPVKSGVDGTLVKATENWIVLERRSRLNERPHPGGPLWTEWIPRDAIVSIEFREGYDEVAQR